MKIPTKHRTVSDDSGGNSLSDTSTSAGVKSTAIRTSVNIFEASKRDKPQYFVDKVKDKRRTKNNNLEFLIGWRGFPDPKDDTWEPLGHLSGSEHMIREFNEQWEKDYVSKMGGHYWTVYIFIHDCRSCCETGGG